MSGMKTESRDTPVIELDAERPKRIHEIHEKRLQRMRQAFEQALPLQTANKQKKQRKRKKR